MSLNQILYCGMADDIIKPLELVPDFDTMYAIDLFDMAFAKHGTWEGQKDDIKSILTFGNNKYSNHCDIMGQNNARIRSKWIVYLELGPCSILENVDEGNRWQLIFRYGNKIRKLIYFHHTDFKEIWPEEINEITHVMHMATEFHMFNPCLRDSLLQRTVSDCVIYDNVGESYELLSDRFDRIKRFVS